MRSLRAFLPPHLLASLATSRGDFELPRRERIEAALLLSDVSGFTPLTEELHARGREGAEEIARVINRAFAPAIAAIERRGGSIQSFGGDALFSIFAGKHRVARAIACAEAVRAAFIGAGQLAISQAVHNGAVAGLHLGTRDRRHYLVTGPAVSALARLQSLAGAGAILVSPTARRVLGRRATRDGPRVAGPAPSRLLRAYLPPPLVSLLHRFHGEYRRVTILFLETRLLAAEKLQSFLLRLTAALDEYGGVLLKSDLSPSGARWLCAFGIPAVHEDDPDRAARAALAIRGPEVRGGIHAGVVANIVIGTSTRRSFDIMGDAVNTAARAMTESAWGEVWITAATLALASGIETEERGRKAVKGKKEALDLHALRSARAMARRVRLAAPVVGRDAELGILAAALDQARAGHGSAIGIRGDAGLGKSRLKYEAALRARASGFDVNEGCATSLARAPYGAASDLVRSVLMLPDTPGKEDVLDRVTRAVDRLGLASVDRHHLADLLGARYPDSPLHHLQPADVRVNTMIAIRSLLHAASRERPRLYVLEDMQWADGASSEAAEWIAREISEAPMVLLLLYRPGFSPAHGAREIALRELGSEDVARLAEAHLGPVPDSVGRLVEERAGGNPFYVEELARHLIEAGLLATAGEGRRLVRAPRPDDLPDGIEAVIAARLDRLAAGSRRVAQCGSVIGRRFLFEILAHLPEAAEEAGAAVADLAEREILFESAREPYLEYIFKHALTRDVAYAGILSARRRILHRAVALAIEELHAGDREPFLPMLGHHWEQAGQRAKASSSYLEAARAAVRRYVHEEAEALYRSYLALLLRPTPESVGARIELGDSVLRHRGRMDEADAELCRAIEEARTLRHAPSEARALRALALVARESGHVEEARRHLDGANSIATREGLRALEAALRSDIANLDYEVGRIEDARTGYQLALEIHREVGNEKGVGATLGNLALIANDQGRMDQALAGYQQSLASHRKAGDRRSEALVLTNIASQDQEQGRLDAASTGYERALAIARDVGDRRLEGILLGLAAVVQYEQGRTDESRAGYASALGLLRETRNRRFEGITLANVGCLEMTEGRVDEALRHYNEALAIDREVGNRRSEAIVLSSLAYATLIATGDVAASRDIARRSEVILTEIDDALQLATLRCTMGAIALAAGQSAASHLGAARKTARAAGAGPTSDLGRAIQRLARSQAAYTSGRPLVCGHCPEVLPSGQLDWLLAHRPEALPRPTRARLRGKTMPEEAPRGAGGQRST